MGCIGLREQKIEVLAATCMLQPGSEPKPLPSAGSEPKPLPFLDQLAGCSMVTIEPNKYTAEVHDRMPVILVEAKDFEQWEHGDYKDAVSRLKLAVRTCCGSGSVEAREQVVWEHDDATLIEPRQI
jgi:putative SOS response-associated peptidase YedK